jgi:hypothetical protein
MWVQLYDAEARIDRRPFFDARPFSTLSFWIRGRAGGERILLKVADREWEEREDALPIGEIGAFLPTGKIETEWQQAVVPVDLIPPRIRRDLIALLVFEAVVPGTTAIEIGPIGFSQRPDLLTPWPESPEQAEEPRSLGKATWVWNTRDLIRSPASRDSLFDFLGSEGVDHVFLQLPGVPGRQSLPGELAIDVESMRRIMGDLNDRGMRVYALDGAAQYALSGFHAGVLRTIDHVARYNEEVPPHERFFGVRYDIEPYLLPRFHGPNRQRLVEGLLQLTQASVERAHAAGLVYGADIPFWYDVVSEDTYERILVEYGEEQKPLSEHIIDMVDDVSIMDYRTVAHGADGTIRHGTGELEYAEAQGKSVFIGLETFPLPDEVLMDFQDEPERNLPTAEGRGPIVVIGSARDSIFAALITGESTRTTALEAAIGWVEETNLDADDVWWWPVIKRVDVPASKITFAGTEPRSLREVMRATAEEFSRYGSFAGFAIHHAESYRTLLKGALRSPGVRDQ